MEALEELNVIIEVIFLQLARVDVLIMSYVPSSPGPQSVYQKVVMMLCCSSVVVLLFMSGCWLGHSWVRAWLDCQPVTAGGSSGPNSDSRLQ